MNIFKIVTTILWKSNNPVSVIWMSWNVLDEYSVTGFIGVLKGMLMQILEFHYMLGSI